MFFFAAPVGAFAQCVLESWAPQSVGTSRQWISVTYGAGKFVVTGWTNASLTSSDGMSWAEHSAPHGMYSVTYGNGIFVGVDYGNHTHQVLSSPDGEDWTEREAAEMNPWQSVTFGDGLFVAVALSGTNRIMTSPDGINWTARAAPGDVAWSWVTYGGGQFVAVGNNAVMTSSDGINWTLQSVPGSSWTAVAYGRGKYVAISAWGSGDRVMVSENGRDWIAHPTPDTGSRWAAITYGGGLFLATSWDGSDRVMTSPDGENWSVHAVEANAWQGAAFGKGKFVVVASDGANRVMTSECTGDFCEEFGARDWIDGAYKYCDGAAWQNFSYDGTAGSCSAAGQMEWHDGQAAHTICDGADRQILRWADHSCSLTSEMLSIGESVSNAGWVGEINAFTTYDNGTKAVAHGRWATNLLTLDISNAPAAPTVIATSSTASGRMDVGELVVRNGHVFGASPQAAANAGRIWASPLSNISTRYSYPTSGSVSGNRMCHALGLAMNDAGTVAFVPAWDSGGASCPASPAESAACILNVFDTSDPANMSAVAHVNLSAMASNGNVYCNGAYFRDDKLFVSFASGPGNGGMMILDVSNPAAPAVLGEAWLSGMGNSQIDHMDVSADGNLAILGSRAGRVVSVDVSNPSSPAILDSDLFVPISSWITDVVVVKNYAFISANPNYIHAVNISDPAALTLDATISDDMFADIGHMELLGDRIFYTSHDDGRFGMLELSCDVENSGPPDLGACSKTAAIDFEPDAPLYKYCDGGNWRPMTPDPCGATAPIQAVTNATETATDLVRSGTLQNTTDGPRFTLSLWFKMKPHTSNPETQVLFENVAGRIQLGFYSTSPSATTYDLWVNGKNSSDTYRAQLYAHDAVTEGVWYHLIASVDTTLGVGRIYINGAEVSNYGDQTVSSGGQAMDIQASEYLVHLFGWSGGFQGEIADFWFDDSYVDLSVEANRRKFITASGTPASLGADGSGPTGAQPLIFFSGDAAQWGTNKGRGGAFTQQGTFQNTATLSNSFAAGVGTACFDGTVYVGQSPDGDVPMFTTPGDPEFGLPWGPVNDVHLGITNWYTGRANSAALAALGEWVAPAAYYCETLNEHGHNDWYLPSVSELLLLDKLSGTPAELDGQYWSSTEVPYDPEDDNTLNRALPVTFPGTYIDWWRGKGDYRGVRCVRRAPSPADPCAGTPAVGTLCADGTIYGGVSPDGNRPMYITQDLAPGYYRWGPNGTNTGLTDCTGAQASCDTGYANTVLLAGLGASYEAATYCHNLTIHGHDDWYLPSRNELNRLYENLGPSPQYGFGDWHWSSSERAAGTAWDQDFSDGEQATSGKQDYDYVRCVRKD